ncbi:hypothetical protein [Chitinophaga solisilvae]|uniref:Uncharacterized protein n=1 Tax=Chitinophaga solisilvae TaxID=1233460 RepID=A0A433WGM4_9BACT|nr:hypothetical protein [Chitinophaga solisilvae]NSL86573.1 hypothetical protein [Chitinophaga solisilvae]
MSDSPRRPIPADAGDFISRAEMDLLCKNHDDDHANQKSLNGHVKAMCFGKDKIQQLLDQPGCTAVRIYYGLKIDTDGDGIKEKKMVLVAVDEDGNDILPPAGDPATGAVAKSMSSALILDQGIPCPEYCSTKPPTKPQQ